MNPGSSPPPPHHATAESSSLVFHNARERQAMLRLPREDLEDRLLRLHEENLFLKQHGHKQEEQLKRLATKLVKLAKDQRRMETLVAGRGGGGASGADSSETEQATRELQETVRALRQQNDGLKQRLLQATRRQLQAQIKRRTPYGHVQPRVDTGLKRSPGSTPSPPHPHHHHLHHTLPIHYHHQGVAKGSAEEAGGERQYTDMEELVRESDFLRDNLRRRERELEEQQGGGGGNVDMLRLLQRRLAEKAGAMTEMEQRLAQLQEYQRGVGARVEELTAQLGDERLRSSALEGQLQRQGRHAQDEEEEAERKVKEAEEAEKERERQNRTATCEHQLLMVQVERLQAELADSNALLDGLRAEAERSEEENRKLLQSQREEKEKEEEEEKEKEEKEKEEKEKEEKEEAAERSRLQQQQQLRAERERSRKLTEENRRLQARLVLLQQQQRRQVEEAEERLDSTHATTTTTATATATAAAEESVEAEPSESGATEASTLISDQKPQQKSGENEKEKERQQQASHNVTSQGGCPETRQPAKTVQQHRTDRGGERRAEAEEEEEEEEEEAPTRETEEQARAAAPRGVPKVLAAFRGSSRPRQFDEEGAASALERVVEAHLEVHLGNGRLSPTALRCGSEPCTYCAYAFYRFELDVTPVARGPRPAYDFTARYAVRGSSADRGASDFLRYLDGGSLTVELHLARGRDFHKVAAGEVSLRPLLESHEVAGDVQLMRLAAPGAAETPEQSLVVGSVEFWLRLRRPAVRPGPLPGPPPPRTLTFPGPPPPRTLPGPPSRTLSVQGPPPRTLPVLGPPPRTLPVPGPPPRTLPVPGPPPRTLPVPGGGGGGRGVGSESDQTRSEAAATSTSGRRRGSNEPSVALRHSHLDLSLHATPREHDGQQATPLLQTVVTAAEEAKERRSNVAASKDRKGKEETANGVSVEKEPSERQLCVVARLQAPPANATSAALPKDPRELHHQHQQQQRATKHRWSWRSVFGDVIRHTVKPKKMAATATQEGRVTPRHSSNA